MPKEEQNIVLVDRDGRRKITITGKVFVYCRSCSAMFVGFIQTGAPEYVHISVNRLEAHDSCPTCGFSPESGGLWYIDSGISGWSPMVNGENDVLTKGTDTDGKAEGE